MTDEQINIAIAEVCGWSVVSDTLCNVYPNSRTGEPELNPVAPLPDYCQDLNAMHEAERALTESGVNAWWAYVAYINRYNATPFGVETAVHATARQRAEAFLRTVGKWEEGGK
jgi:hypothetical protein